MAASKLPPIIVVSGSSGSGKTTLCRMVASRLHFYYTISHTTRLPRSNEKEGNDYHFVSEEKFLQMIKDDEFLEWAIVYGKYYGTSKKLVLERLQKGQGVIVDVDTQGAVSIKKIFPNAVLVFIKAPSQKDLRVRLYARGTESTESINTRLKQAAVEEMSQHHYDTILVNQDLDECYQSLEKIIKKCMVSPARS